jgi:hypothetical protein
MRFRAVVVALAGLTAGAMVGAVAQKPTAPQAKAGVVTVYKTATCGCCKLWIDHMKAAGFEVRGVDLEDLTETKQTSGVPMRLRTCHTAIVDGYVVEGHVPADLVKKMLAERPKVTGIVVPGMPIGSPGMEQGNQKDPYEVLLFDKTGKTTVYAKR